MFSDATLPQVLLWAATAALAAALGPLVAAPRLPPRWLLGWASALAAGAMLGTAYVLMTVGIEARPIDATIGGAIGVLFTYVAHRLLGLGLGSAPTTAGGDDGASGNDATRTAASTAPRAAAPPAPRLALLASTVHAAPEGVAIGAAFAVSARLGVALALTLAVHNVWEGAVLADHLTPAGLARPRAMLLAVASNLPQVGVGGVVFALARTAPPLLPSLLGVAFGALVYLCLAELLPESYGAAGRTGIAVVATVAAGVVGLIGSAFR